MLWIIKQFRQGRLRINDIASFVTIYIPFNVTNATLLSMLSQFYLCWLFVQNSSWYDNVINLDHFILACIIKTFLLYTIFMYLSSTFATYFSFWRISDILHIFVSHIWAVCRISGFPQVPSWQIAVFVVSYFKDISSI